MVVNASKPEINIREELAALRRNEQTLPQPFPFTGNGSETRFSLPVNWKPWLVYLDGAYVREGPGEAYTLDFDGFIWTVVFAVAPGAVNVDILAYRVKA